MNTESTQGSSARSTLRLPSLAVLLAGLLCGAAGAATSFKGPLDTPSQPSALAAKSPLLAVATAGQRVVGVGLRGHIVYSDDGGRQWTQARVPVSTDLVAVTFSSSHKGWAVGHEGVILHTEDGGLTWARQLDGREAARIAESYYAKAGPDAASDAVRKQAKAQLAEAEGGAPGPFFDVSFDNDGTGYVIGAFNRLFHTDDGGKTWIPWSERIDNPGELHLYAIRGSGDQRYIVGEQGKVWRLDAPTRRFVAVPTPYNGTLFGAVVTPASVVVFGMSGTAYRSTNQGRSWDKVDIGSRAGITGGAILPDGRMALVNQAGQLLVSEDGGNRFKPVKSVEAMPSYFGVVCVGERALGVVGIDGVKVLALP
jgi:photosystem II stability/assembly factor-like uncharacterized protein